MTRLILLVALVLGMVSTSTAQSFSTYDGKSDAYWQTLEVQIKRSLEENLEGIATQQLRNVIVFRSLYADRVDLSDAVPAIIQIHRRSSDRETRELAVAALNAVNSFEARSYVRNRVSRSELLAARLAARDAIGRVLDHVIFAEDNTGTN